MVDVRGVEVFEWNPRRPVVPGRLGALLPVRRTVGNFGDLLGPLVVCALAAAFGGAVAPTRRLLSIGSVLHFSRDGDVVWGSGVNGKIPVSEISARDLDVRAVRGPLTAEVLARLGIVVPEVYGDPGLLAPELLGISRAAHLRREIVVIPHLHDVALWCREPGFVSPRAHPAVVIASIAEARFVAASSLHGLVIADALGVPSALLRPSRESLVKYRDYYEGTGRRLPRVNESVGEARRHEASPLAWDPSALLAAFPSDLWTGENL